jgi:hypothetical protein
VDVVVVGVAVVSGLLVLYTVVRLAVRDGVLDARARDDAQLAQRKLDLALRESREIQGDSTRLDDLLDADDSV